MKALTEFIAKSLVEHPEDVAVEEIKTGNQLGGAENGRDDSGLN